MSEISGQTNSETPSLAKQKLTDLNKKLDDFELSIGLPQFKAIPSIQQEAIKYLELTPEFRSKLTPDDAEEAALVLAQYAAHITRACQRCESAAAWLEEEVDQVIAARLQMQNGYGFKEKKLLGVSENDHAKNIENMRREISARHKRLIYLSQRIEAVGKAYSGLANRERRGRQYGDRGTSG